MYVAVIDVSEHQGDIDFEKMRTSGCEGVIIRCCHGQTEDRRFEQNWEEANQAFPGKVGVYPFVNPKRGTPLECATFLERQLRHLAVPFLMFDVESYKDESPNKGVIWPASEFRPWLREHVAAVRRLLPDVVLIGYSNASFWNVWVQDEQLAGELEWIVPRYPIYSLNGYVLNPLPTPVLWSTWAFRVGPTGPTPPKGATWDGWQFSAGHNRQGVRYGCQSSDLDLNIIKPEAWARWTRQGSPPSVPQPQPPSEEPDMPYIFKLDNDYGIRDVTGSRYLNPGEREAVYPNEPVITVNSDAWKDWVRRELEKYVRELDAPAPIQVTVPPIKLGDMDFTGRVVPHQTQ